MAGILTFANSLKEREERMCIWEDSISLPTLRYHTGFL